MNRPLLLLLSLIAAVTVGNLYLSQPLLAVVGRAFHEPSSRVGWVVTLAQIGYGVGTLLLVPLGDLMERRRLLLILLGAVTTMLALAAGAPSLSWLLVASLCIGFTTIVPQVIIPYAASLASTGQRGSVLGVVQGGLLLGILLARVVSGAIGATAGWRMVFLGASILCGLLLALVAWTLPSQPVVMPGTYLSALSSMARLTRDQPVLRSTALMSGTSFGVFTSFWTVLPFLLESEYGKGPAFAGLFGLIGAAGALAAGLAGRLIDAKGARFTQVLTLSTTLLSFPAFVLGGHSLPALVVAVVLMDAGIQATHLACQAEALALDDTARSRINGVYIFVRLAGGAAGSAAGMAAYTRWGWSGFCGCALAFALASFVPLWMQRRRAV